MTSRLRSRDAEPMRHEAAGMFSALGGLAALVLLVALVAVLRDGV